MDLTIDLSFDRLTIDYSHRTNTLSLFKFSYSGLDFELPPYPGVTRTYSGLHFELGPLWG